ncbi:MAG: DUF1294 domain-containing protein [Clostridiales bacterium]|nr:DUF1294 domain-containing protein [Clostridiales bacterium]
MAMYIMYAYYGAATLALFIFMAVDKRRALEKRWRIRESTLILLGFAGGAVGGWLGMFLFHHKSQKPKFYIGFAAALILHAAIVFLLIKYAL